MDTPALPQYKVSRYQLQQQVQSAASWGGATQEDEEKLQSMRARMLENETLKRYFNSQEVLVGELMESKVETSAKQLDGTLTQTDVGQLRDLQQRINKHPATAPAASR